MTPSDVPPSDPSGPGEPPPEPRPASEADQAWRAFAHLLSGPLVYGGAGWLADRWLGTGFLLPVGLVGGMALSLYLIWFRYGTHWTRTHLAEAPSRARQPDRAARPAPLRTPRLLRRTCEHR